MMATKTGRVWAIRWMVRRDLPAVLEIERASFDCPWSEAGFMLQLKRRNCIGLVVTEQMSFEPIGYEIYSLQPRCVELLSIAVRPDCRRSGCGVLMVAKVSQRLSQSKRRRTVTRVRETNLGAHLFLRACGFRAMAVARRFYDNGEDSYVFQYDVNPIGAILAARAAISVR